MGVVEVCGVVVVGKEAGELGVAEGEVGVGGEGRIVDVVGVVEIEVGGCVGGRGLEFDLGYIRFTAIGVVHGGGGEELAIDHISISAGWFDTAPLSSASPRSPLDTHIVDARCTIDPS